MYPAPATSVPLRKSRREIGSFIPRQSSFGFEASELEGTSIRLSLWLRVGDTNLGDHDESSLHLGVVRGKSALGRQKFLQYCRLSPTV
jgi:hypothetical protein